MPTGVAWNPDGSVLCAISGKGEICCWNPEAGELIHQDKTQAGDQEVKWKPNGNRIATINFGTGPAIYTFTGSELVEPLFSLKDSGVGDLAWSPDGSRIATISRNGIIQIVDTSNGAITLRIKVGTEPPYHSDHLNVEWSPDGRSIAYSLEKEGMVKTLNAPGWTVDN